MDLDDYLPSKQMISPDDPDKWEYTDGILFQAVEKEIEGTLPEPHLQGWETDGNWSLEWKGVWLDTYFYYDKDTAIRIVFVEDGAEQDVYDLSHEQFFLTGDVKIDVARYIEAINSATEWWLDD